MSFILFFFLLFIIAGAAFLGWFLRAHLKDDERVFGLDPREASRAASAKG